MNERRLRLELKPSPPLAIAIIALHGVAAACAFLTLPRVAGALIAVALLALGGIAAWSVALLRSPASVRALELEGPKASVVCASGRGFPVEMAKRRYVGRFLVSIALRHPVRRTILVTPDMLGGDLFRRLRVWALWGRLPAVAAKQLPA